jgi:hypothetical protein
MSRTKIAGIILGLIVGFYVLQYVGTKVHYGCADPREDCPPPIYLAGEVLYRLLVEPPWLTYH